MLSDRKEEQATLLKEILLKKLTVREAEAIARRIAQDKVRNKAYIDPEMIEIENKFAASLGTRVQIERKEKGGKVMIDFFSPEDLQSILQKITQTEIGAVSMSEPSPEKPVDDRAPEEIKKEEDSEDLYALKNFSL